jgi:hypothetical protein
MMSIASPKLPPVVLTSNTNGQNQSSASLKKELNNNVARTSNGTGAKPAQMNKKETVHESPVKRNSRVLHSSDESDDEPLVDERDVNVNVNVNHRFLFRRRKWPRAD